MAQHVLLHTLLQQKMICIRILGLSVQHCKRPYRRSIGHFCLAGEQEATCLIQRTVFSLASILLILSFLVLCTKTPAKSRENKNPAGLIAWVSQLKEGSLKKVVITLKLSWTTHFPANSHRQAVKWLVPVLFTQAKCFSEGAFQS